MIPTSINAKEDSPYKACFGRGSVFSKEDAQIHVLSFSIRPEANVKRGLDSNARLKERTLGRDKETPSGIELAPVKSSTVLLPSFTSSMLALDFSISVLIPAWYRCS